MYNPSDKNLRLQSPLMNGKHVCKTLLKISKNQSCNMGATSAAASVQSTACGVVTEPLINSASPPHAWEAKCKMHSAKKTILLCCL